jgi:hypothetical protein
VRVAFSGTGDTLSFVAPAPNGPAGAGLYQYTLNVAASASQKALVVGLSPFTAKRPGRDTEVARLDHVLVTNVKSFGIRYYGRSDQRALPAWLGTWTRADAIPELVELTVEHGEGAFSLIVELQLRPRRL